MSQVRARLALLGFCAIAGGIVTNVIAFQEPRRTSSIERARHLAEEERLRRLALAAAPLSAAPDAYAAPLAAPPVKPTRIARLKPDSAVAIHPFAHREAAAAPETVRALQRELTQRGYEPGAADGTIGLATRAAVMAYEQDQGIPVTGEPSEALLKRLLLGVTPGDPLPPQPTREARQRVEHIVRTVQETLAALGYMPGAIDGHLGTETDRAIREFEMDQGVVPTGRISGRLINRLARAAGTKLPGAGRG